MSSLPVKPTAMIVGAGLMGRFHAQAAHFAGATVVAVVDTELSAARVLAGTLPDAVARATIPEALRHRAPDSAHVCTPLASHVMIAKELASAGIHALVEKPLSGTPAQTRAVLDSFAAADRIVCPVHQYAFQRSVDLAMARLPGLGPIRRIEFDIRSAGGGADASRFDGLAEEILPHPLSIIQRFMPAIDIGDLEWTLERPAAGEWQVTAVAGSTMLVIAISLHARPTCFLTRVLCDGGTIELNNFHDYGIVSTGAATRRTKIVQPFARGTRELASAVGNLARRAVQREVAYPGLRALTASFYRSVIGLDNASPIGNMEMMAEARARSRIVAQLDGNEGRGSGVC